MPPAHLKTQPLGLGLGPGRTLPTRRPRPGALQSRLHWKGPETAPDARKLRRQLLVIAHPSWMAR